MNGGRASCTTVSAFWILCLDSWMQTPVGYEMVDGVFHVTSWGAILTNPSFPEVVTASCADLP